MLVLVALALSLGSTARAAEPVAQAPAPVPQATEGLPPAFVVEPAPELTGRFGIVVDVPLRMRLSWLGEIDVTYRSVLLADIQREGGRLVQRLEICDTFLDEESPAADLQIDWEQAAAMTGPTYPIELDGKRYRADLGVRNIGLARGFTGPLPHEPGAAGVVDGDGDGNPGVTMDVSTAVAGMEVFLVQRDQPILVGEVQGDGYVVGRVRMPLLEQQVLGTAPPTSRPSIETEVLEARGRFELFRVDEKLTCRQLQQSWMRYRDRARRGA